MNRKKWTEDELKALVKMHYDGFDLYQIADRLGRSRYSVSHRWRWYKNGRKWK